MKLNLELNEENKQVLEDYVKNFEQENKTVCANLCKSLSEGKEVFQSINDLGFNYGFGSEDDYGYIHFYFPRQKGEVIYVIKKNGLINIKYESDNFQGLLNIKIENKKINIYNNLI